MAAVLATVLVTLLLPLLSDPRHYFYGDTPAAYYGWWYHLGNQLRSGNWPLLDPQAWRAGGLAAEGQWGVYSPLVMAIGLLTTVSGNVLLLATCIKVGLALVGSLGVFALVRSYGAPYAAACVAAVAAPLGGMTQYLDLPSWSAALMIWALLPWVWWAIRRTMLQAANPLPALLLAYLLVTVGYVYGTIMLFFVLIASLLDCWALRDRRAAFRVVGIGLFCGLIAIAVYLPGVLTFGVTIRDRLVSGSGVKFSTGVLQMFTSVLPTAAFQGISQHLIPYAYAVWFLPVLAWVDFGKVRQTWRPLTGLTFMTVTTLLIVNASAPMGPLRWPLRMQTFLVQMLVVLCVVLLSRYAVRRPSVGRLVVALVWVVLAGVVVVIEAPSIRTGHVLSVAMVCTGLLLLWLFLRLVPRRPVLVAALATLFTVLVAALQHAYYPTPPSPKRNMPALLADYQTQLATAQGDVLVVGDSALLLETTPAAATDFLIGSAWYLNPHPVQNTYTTISFSGYYDRYCIYYEGSTCPELLDTLFTIEPVTGLERVDLLAVSTLLIVRAEFSEGQLFAPPQGWHVSDSTRWSVTWVRDKPGPTAGGPVWSSASTVVAVEYVDSRTVRMRVDKVPPTGGRVVLSRLAWPGYEVDSGRLGESADGYLLNVELPASADGEVVTVHFSPPGWGIEIASWWLAVLGGLGWSTLVWSRRRPRRSEDNSPVATSTPLDM